jgi:hypothetical protein
MENLDHEEQLALLFREQGKTKVHICPNAYHMAIHEQSPEYEACQCDKEELK